MSGEHAGNARRLVGDRFELVSHAAHGGMGSVWRARDHRDSRDVALKLVRADDGAVVERFMQEVGVLAGLEDRHVVRYVAHGVAPGNYLYLAMEWLEGRDLATRLRQGPLGARDLLRVLVAAARGLGAAHARGVIHRDVKPANLFLQGDDPAAVKLLDFGLARVRGADRLTRTGVWLGTVGYMAPEQISGGEVDARADLFALGCVAFELCTGRPPFAGEHGVAVLARVLKEPLPSLESEVPGLPRALTRMLDALLERDPRDRPADAGELAAQLERFDTDALDASPPQRSSARHEVAPSHPVIIALARWDDEGAPLSGGGSSLAERARGLGFEASLVDVDALLLESEPEGWLGDALDRLLGLAWEEHHRSDGAGFAIDLLGADTFDRGVLFERLAGRAVPGGLVEVGDAAAALCRSHWALEGAPGAFRVAGTRPVATVRCVGRERELKVALASFEQCVEEGQASALSLIGAPGAGKTRLIEAILDTPAVARARVLVASGQPARRGLERDLTRRLLRDAVGAPASSGEAELALRFMTLPAGGYDVEERRAFAAQLARLCVEGLTRHASSPSHPPASTSVDRAVLGCLGHLAADGPTVIVVDDLGFADAASVELLRRACVEHASLPLFVLTGSRLDARALHPRWFELEHATELRLDRLSTSAAEALLGALAPQLDDAARAAWIAVAKGHPGTLGLAESFPAPPPWTALLGA